MLHLISQGKPSARKTTRARILLKAHEGLKAMLRKEADLELGGSASSFSN